MDKYEIVILVMTILAGVWGIILGTSKVVNPLIQAITKLNVTVENVSKELKELKLGNTESHKRIWEQVDRHTDTLNDHETRIKIIEEESHHD